MITSGEWELQVVAWDDPDARLLRNEQQAGLAELYDGTEDIEPELPPAEMVRTALLRVAGEPVATGSIRLGPHLPADHAELKRMYVRPAWRGRGLSRPVLAELERAAAGLGLRRLALETGLRQVAAIGLYRSAGYRRIANFGIYADEPTSVCYAKWLAADDHTWVLVVNGSVAAGKTTVADRIGHLLGERGVPHVVLDVDALTDAKPVPVDDPYHQQLAIDALTRLAPLYRERGLRHVVLPRVVEARAEVEAYERAFDGADVTVVRLRVPEATRLARVSERERTRADWELARTVELEANLETAGADDAVVDAVDSPEQVAAQVLAAAGW